MELYKQIWELGCKLEGHFRKIDRDIYVKILDRFIEIECIKWEFGLSIKLNPKIYEIKILYLKNKDCLYSHDAMKIATQIFRGISKVRHKEKDKQMKLNKFNKQLYPIVDVSDTERKYKTDMLASDSIVQLEQTFLFGKVFFAETDFICTELEYIKYMFLVEFGILEYCDNEIDEANIIETILYKYLKDILFNVAKWKEYLINKIIDYNLIDDYEYAEYLNSLGAFNE